MLQYNGFRVFNDWHDLALAGQTLKLADAPLTLSAIVNQIDLRNDESAGELHFVFTDNWQLNC